MKIDRHSFIMEVRELHLAFYSIGLGVFEDLPQIICIIALARWTSLTSIMKLCLSIFMLLAKILTPFLYKPDLCLFKYICGEGAPPLISPETNFDVLNGAEERRRG